MRLLTSTTSFVVHSEARRFSAEVTFVTIGNRVVNTDGRGLDGYKISRNCAIWAFLRVFFDFHARETMYFRAGDC